MALTVSSCNLCPRACGADRQNGITGFCGVGAEIIAARAALHMWEEPCISGSRGSGAVFFAGCNLRCVYCQNHEIAAARTGRQIKTARLADIFLKLQEKGAANINLVTPSHYVLAIREALLSAKKQGLQLPIVYNCGGYEKVEALRQLEDLVDIYLTDFKYGEEELAGAYSAAPDYPTVAAVALAEMVRQQPKLLFGQEGYLQKGVIVRHLLLPGHVKNGKKVIKYVYENFGDQVLFSLMNQYTPLEAMTYDTGFPELHRKVTTREYDRFVDYAIELGIENAFIQEGETAKESFIPPFDCEGI